MHDPVATFYLVNKEATGARNYRVEIEKSSKFCNGRTFVDTNNYLGRSPNCHVGVKLDAE